MLLLLLMLIVSVRTVHLARKVPATKLTVNTVRVLSHPCGAHPATMAAFAPARPYVSAARQCADESGRRYCKDNFATMRFPSSIVTT